jgi:TRAP-type C4-dicarboxylate transport system substrate-binding protein
MGKVMKKCSKLLVPALIASVMSIGMSTASAKELVLRGASFAPMDTTWGIPFKMFVDHVNEIGAGVLKIQAMGPEAMPAVEQPNAVRSGLLDVIATPPGMYKQMVPESNAQDASNMTIEEQRKSGGYAALSALTQQKLGSSMLTTYGPGVNFHIYLTKPIKSIEELKGLRVRSQPIFNSFFKDVGLSTTTIPIPETYTALERGVVQGYGFPSWGIQDLGWDGLTKVRVNPGIYNVVVNVLVNDKRLKSLTPEQRKVLDDSAVWFEAKMKTYMKEQNAIHNAVQVKAGIQNVDLGAGFSKRAADVLWNEMAATSPQKIAELRALLQK